MPNALLETVPPLSVKAIEAARPADKDYELRDPGAPGLRLRVTRKGTKVFRWYVTALGRVITIGKWSKVPRPGYVTLAEAHGWLERLRLAYHQGCLSAAEAELAAARRPRPLLDASPPADGTVAVRQVAQEFRKFLYRERKRPEQGWRPMEYDILPAIGNRPIAAVTPQDCRAIVEAVVARGSTVQAGAVLAIMKQFFNFAVDRADLESSPAERFRNPRALGVEKNISQRFLTPDGLDPV